MKDLAERRKLEDLTIGPVLTVRMNVIYKIVLGLHMVSSFHTSHRLAKII